MTIVFVILLIVASVVLGFFVLVQNPKGGGLAGNIAGFSTQFMGVKQTTDVLEKGTWIFSAVVGLLALFSSLLISNTGSTGNNRNQDISAPAPNTNTGGNNTTPFSSGQSTPTNTAPDTTR